jgi:hypothetical protein
MEPLRTPEVAARHPGHLQPDLPESRLPLYVVAVPSGGAVVRPVVLDDDAGAHVQQSGGTLTSGFGEPRSSCQA